ncbi:hypothetical protein BLL42_28285 (plasmid) [Pseudomonas frederiksbergensis]|uniref:Uncharacterized protein n=1 Tax=Pseudomonas frederiksbergensis TaxID=104087 RepID=A0A1J0EV16_9PSED|nr:hypothetical protein [Pseudomonas frederiksbergensis]APC19612.1 hypothetical protein BLL42_28285 [Pseudomonas frederiksbergensis]
MKQSIFNFKRLASCHLDARSKKADLAAFAHASLPAQMSRASARSNHLAMSFYGCNLLRALVTGSLLALQSISAYAQLSPADIPIGYLQVADDTARVTVEGSTPAGFTLTAVAVYVNGRLLAFDPPIVGQTLEARLTCSAVCNDVPADGYQWEIQASVGSGSYIPISNATTSTYLVRPEDQKKAIRVSVP